MLISVVEWEQRYLHGEERRRNVLETGISKMAFERFTKERWNI